MDDGRRPGGARCTPRWAVVATVWGSAAVAGAAFLPWGASGRAMRSGFALARISRSLELAPSLPARALVASVALLPLLAAATWLAACLGRTGVLAALGATSGILAVVGAAVLWRTPLRPGVGPVLALAAGTIACAGATALARGRVVRTTWTPTTG